MGCPLRIESAPFLIDLKFKSARTIILRITTFPSPAGACLGEAASAKAGERVRVRVDIGDPPSPLSSPPRGEEIRGGWCR
jgi:hypothetical protein